eukprot:CAMPEP_0197415680 /NCGR_PEP_ID=MMETSP1170-20131217/2149_1 /TAXON_ID=54406 /ORGANISM="Sarcinochrysis sp, Strain CCMP770" /LENGTH=48 /DNA_ID= /DNA_START= /DNA_END= /DNA_ORIENTATION=
MVGIQLGSAGDAAVGHRTAIDGAAEGVADAAVDSAREGAAKQARQPAV